MVGIEPISVEFPLRGEWMAANAPGTKVPSHGTDALGQTYAYDFMGVDPGQKSLKFFKKSSNLDYLLGRSNLNDFYGWNKPIFAPFSGTVVESSDGYLENSTHARHILSTIFKNIFQNLEKLSVQELAGNYVILRGEEAYAFFAHMRKDSVKVKQGNKIKSGDLIGEVGHSSNSTAPHLHFHLMDSANILTAKGIPCSFKEYELYHQGEWIKVENGIPKNKDRIRHNVEKS